MNNFRASRRLKHMHAQHPGWRIVKRQRGIVERLDLSNTGGNRGQQLPDVEIRDQCVRHFQQKGFAGALPFGDVACDLGEAQQVAVFVMQCQRPSAAANVSSSFGLPRSISSEV